MSTDDAQLTEAMVGKLEQAETRFEELNQLLADPEVLSDPQRLQEIGREQSSLQGLISLWPLQYLQE